MLTGINEINSMLRSIGIESIDSINFGGQLSDNVWHATDCKIIGHSKNSFGPYPFSYLKDKMSARCCTIENALLYEILPSGVSKVIRALNGLRLLESSINGLYTERDLHAGYSQDVIDASNEFLDEISEYSGSIAHNLIMVPHTNLLSTGNNLLFDLAKELDDKLTAIESRYFSDPNFLAKLKSKVLDELGTLGEDDEVFVASVGSVTGSLEDSDNALLFDVLANTFVVSSRRINLSSNDRKSVSLIPEWGYLALKELAPCNWLSKPYKGIEHKVLETALTIWKETSSGDLDDFDSCIVAAKACFN